MTSNREQWGTNFGFILAAVGSAVGLGNIWKFPFIAGMNGGAAFVLIYIICVVVIGFPVMLMEFGLGRLTHKNPVGAFRSVDRSGGKWYLVGAMGVLAGFIILSYYSVVAGWCLGYVWKALHGVFSLFQDAAHAGDHFTASAATTRWAIFYHGLFMALCISIVIGGVKSGIERASKILMPSLIIILIILVIRGVTLPGASSGLKFLFKPDFSKITGDTILVALGHAFFTLSLGMGAMITYGSYLSRKDNLVTSAIIIAILDTSVAILAGIAIFTAVFAYDLEPAAGPGLIFHVLPAIFSEMPGGAFFGLLFFLLMSIAALTSGISLLEVITAYFIDERGWPRKQATLTFGIVIFLLGIPSAMSFGALADWHPLSQTAIVSVVAGVLICILAILLGCFDFRREKIHLPSKVVTITVFASGIAVIIAGIFEKYPSILIGWSKTGWTFFDFADYLSFKYLLPLGGLLLAIFTLVVWGANRFIEELKKGSRFNPSSGLTTLILVITIILTVITFIAGIIEKT